MKYKFDFNKFEKELKSTPCMSEDEKKAHYILQTISHYIDCETNFLLSITSDQLAIAMNIINDNDSKKLKAMIMAEGAIGLTSNLKSIKESNKKDLF